MVKGRLKGALSFFVLMKYVFWALFFSFQGKAIELAVGRKCVIKELIFTLTGYVVVKLLVMLADIFIKYLSAYYKNIALQKQWSAYLPKTIYRDNQDSKSDINVLFFDYFPRLFDLEVEILTNSISICFVFVLTVVTFICTGFSIGILALLIVFLLNYHSKNLFIKKIDDSRDVTNKEKIRILNWIGQYFLSFREVSKNWQGLSKSSWKEDVYRQYFLANKNLNLFYLYRDLLAQGLVELPFLLNTVFMIVGVYCHYLSLSRLFVWFGFSHFLINSSNAYLENKVKKKQFAALIEKVNHILDLFKESMPTSLASFPKDNNIISEVTMRDGVQNRLSLTPGLYHVRGGNASGKSTLMNIVLGFERRYYAFNGLNLGRFIARSTSSNIRVIEREAVIFDCYHDFNSQVCGPCGTGGNWCLMINKTLHQLLPPALAAKWMRIFVLLENEFSCRQEKILSSGERIVLSMMRFLYSWSHEVSLLVIDECDSFFDAENKKLFFQTVLMISNRLAVYITCHDPLFNKVLDKSVLFS